MKYTNPRSGVQYAYESTSRWNPETKRNEPIRKYLGRVDPLTGEIVSTRDKSRQKSAPAASLDVAPELYDENQKLLKALSDLQATVQELRQENEALTKDNRQMRKVLDSIWKQSGEFAHYA